MMNNGSIVDKLVIYIETQPFLAEQVFCGSCGVLGSTTATEMGLVLL